MSIPASLATPFGQVGSGFRVEALNTMIAGIADIDHSLIVNSNARRVLKVRRSGAEHAPQLHKVSCIIELLDPAIARIHHVEIAVLVACQSERWRAEFPPMQEMGAASGLTPSGDTDVSRCIDQNGIGRGSGNIPASILEPRIDCFLPVP